MATTNISPLFQPLRIGSIDLPNRIVMAPMTRNRAGEGNVPGPLMAEYYGQRASAGLIITEASQVSPQGVGYPATPGIHTPEQVAGWRGVTNAVHDRGGRIFLQLWHVGRISHPGLQPDGQLPVAPSAVRPGGDAFTYEGPQPFVTPRALETEEIAGIVEDYRAAAQNAKEAGFDGVEIHAANGYLLDQFLRDGTNRRTDAYGGSLEYRVRLLIQVLEAVASVWKSSRIGVRFSPVNSFNDMTDSDPQRTFTFAAEMIAGLRLAYLHVVETDIGGQTHDPEVFDFGRLRGVFGGVYIANGGYDRQRAERALVEGRADLISFGQSYLANPDLPERFALSAPLNRPDQSTFYGGGEKGYTDYPYLAIEEPES